MGFRRRKKVEEVTEVAKDVSTETVEDKVVTGELEATEEVKVETDIRVGNKVRILKPIDAEGRPLKVDLFDTYLVYAINGNVAQLRKQHVIIFVKLSNIKKVD